jgi:hypothetical protein
MLCRVLGYIYAFSFFSLIVIHHSSLSSSAGGGAEIDASNFQKVQERDGDDDDDVVVVVANCLSLRWEFSGIGNEAALEKVQDTHPGGEIRLA